MDWLLHQCQMLVSDQQGLYAALFGAGLFGGMTHCTGMCGPLVVGQVVGRMDTLASHEMTEMKRLQGAILLPYHLGRVSTYVLCAALAAVLLAQVKNFSAFKYIAFFMIISAAMVFLTSAVGGFLPKLGRVLSPQLLSECLPVNVLHWLNSKAKFLASSPLGWRGYGLGLLLGFMPCGLVYGALMAVAATGDVRQAVGAMALFGFGTFPSLLLVGLGAQGLLRAKPLIVRHVARGVMALNGIFLLMMAGDILLT